MQNSNKFLIISGFVFGLSACNKNEARPSSDSNSDFSTSDSESGMEIPTTSEKTSTSGNDSENSESGEVCNFFDCNTDMSDGIAECNHWSQDCTEGEKCSAWANDGGGAWNSTKCVEVQPNAGIPGDSCTVEGGGTSGIDSCIKGAMCWDTNEENIGTCIALCGGTPEAPICEKEFFCAIANEVLNLCLPGCDPLSQDCSGDNLCIPNGENFLCVLDASGEEGQSFDPCEYGNSCDKGLTCMDPAFGMECTPQATGCCLPFCDLTEPQCPGENQDCLAWFEEGMAPPGFENVGVCGIPQG